MPQPPRYIPVHSFVSDSSTLAGFPGQELDTEFRGIKTTTDAINANLALIQRDDGALGNGVVGYDQLSPALQTNGLAPAVGWATGTAYAAGISVMQGGSLYRCLVAHTSGVFATDLAAGKWLFVTSVPVPPPSPTTLGGVKSLANVAHKWIDSVGIDGALTQTQPAFSDIFGTAAVSQGGTGQITASAAFDALAPTTLRGDIIYRNAVTNTRLPAGTAGFVLQTNGAGADPSWVSVAATATPVMDGAAAVGVATKYAREDHVHPTDNSRQPNITGWAASGVPTLTEFSGGQISTQGVLNNSLSIYASPTAVATSTVFSAAVDYTSLSGSGTAPVASFGATTGASQTAHVRVISSFLEDYSTTATQPVSLFAMARKHGGNASQFVFAANLQVTDDSAGSGAIIGLEIDVDGKSTTASSLGLGIYGRNNGSAFQAGNAILVTSEASGSWSKGLVIDGNIAESGLNTVTMTTSPTAVHMGNNQRLAWDGPTVGSARAWVTFNQATTKFEFFIDGTKVAQLP